MTLCALSPFLSPFLALSLTFSRCRGSPVGGQARVVTVVAVVAVVAVVGLEQVRSATGPLQRKTKSQKNRRSFFETAYDTDHWLDPCAMQSKGALHKKRPVCPLSNHLSPLSLSLPSSCTHIFHLLTSTHRSLSDLHWHAPHTRTHTHTHTHCLTHSVSLVGVGTSFRWPTVEFGAIFFFAPILFILFLRDFDRNSRTFDAATERDSNHEQDADDEWRGGPRATDPHQLPGFPPEGPLSATSGVRSHAPGVQCCYAPVSGSPLCPIGTVTSAPSTSGTSAAVLDC